MSFYQAMKLNLQKAKAFFLSVLKKNAIVRNFFSHKVLQILKKLMSNFSRCHKEKKDYESILGSGHFLGVNNSQYVSSP